MSFLDRFLKPSERNAMINNEWELWPGRHQFSVEVTNSEAEQQIIEDNIPVKFLQIRPGNSQINVFYKGQLLGIADDENLKYYIMPLRKLEKEGYSFSETTDQKDLDNFIEMYYLTMNNAGADTFYYFTKELIKQLYTELGKNIILVKVEKDHVVYSYSLFFISGSIATYYLSSRNSNSWSWIISSIYGFKKSK